MSSNGLPSIARMGAQPYLDATAEMHNGHNYAWLIIQLRRLEAKETTKKEICKEMNITPPVLDKYIFIINLEAAQHDL